MVWDEEDSPLVVAPPDAVVAMPLVVVSEMVSSPGEEPLQETNSPKVKASSINLCNKRPPKLKHTVRSANSANPDCTA